MTFWLLSCTELFDVISKMILLISLICIVNKWKHKHFTTHSALFPVVINIFSAQVAWAARAAM